jgi:hypothetical protein
VTLADVRAVFDSGKALKCIIDEEEYWIPHSQIDDASEVFDDDSNATGKLVITEWLAKEKGLI